MEILIFVFWLFCAFSAAGIANGKHRSFSGWFFLGLLFGPFAWIVAALPPLARKPSTDEIVAAYENEQRAAAARFAANRAADHHDRPILLPPGAVRPPPRRSGPPFLKPE